MYGEDQAVARRTTRTLSSYSFSIVVSSDVDPTVVVFVLPSLKVQVDAPNKSHRTTASCGMRTYIPSPVSPTLRCRCRRWCGSCSFKEGQAATNVNHDGDDDAVSVFRRSAVKQ